MRLRLIGARLVRLVRLVACVAAALAVPACTESISPPDGNPVPTISSVTPSAIAAGSPSTLLTVTGTGFVTGSTIQLGSQVRATTFVSSSELTTQLSVADLASVAEHGVRVHSPPPGGGSSLVVFVSVRDALSVSPALSAAAPGNNVSLSVADFTGAVAPVTWRVNGVPGGNAALGTISASGQYTAPATLPGDSIIVTAVLTSNPTIERAATVFFVPSGLPRDFRIAIPRVVDATAPAPTRFLVVPAGGVTSLFFEGISGGSIPLASIGNGVWTFVMPESFATTGYVTGSLHNTAGFIDEYNGGTRIRRLNLGVNVRDATMPAVAVTALGPDAQRSAHLLNLRHDTVVDYPTMTMVGRALQTLGSGDVDFVAVIANVHTTNNRVYMGVRNDVTGIGLSIFDASGGISSRLKGIIAFPIDAFYDAADVAMTHEIGHRWINFSLDPALSPGRPHWRPSSMASGVMGFSIAGSGAGGTFPWTLTPSAGGLVIVNALTTPGTGQFDPLDLYIMGLLPPDSVPTRYLLAEGISLSILSNGLALPATPYTVADYIGFHGPRVPASDVSQREFRVMTVILSAGRLLTPSEMAFFDHASKRGETTVPLPARSGFSTADAPGFYRTTGGRATLITALP